MAPRPFSHAAASFDPTASGVLLWTRAVGEAEVRWHLEPLDHAAGELRSGTVAVSVLGDWCATVEVEGLEPATTYRYWFEAADGATSPIGRTRTLPLGPCDEVRLGVVCCSDLTMGWFGGYRAMAEEELDLVVHLGDAIYEEGKGGVRGDDLAGMAITLGDYRDRHAATRADPDLLALHLRHPVVFVWDDHDVADNTWRHGAKEHDPDEHGPFEARLLAAAQARQDWMPARLHDPGDLLDMHRSLVLGDLAELVVLDTRIPGRDQQADEPGAPALDDPERTMLGPAQREWALERLADRHRPWSLVATAVTLSPLQLPIAPREVPALDRSMPSGYAVVDGDALCTDEWDGYPAERTRLIEAFAARGGGVVVLSGDVHSSWALEVHDEAGTATAVEFVCPSLTSKPMGEQLPKGTRSLAAQAAEDVPHRRWSDVEANGWLRLTVRTDAVQADWFEVAREAPRPIDPAERQGRPMASWQVGPTLPAELTQAAAPVAAWPDRGGVDPAWPPGPKPDGHPLRKAAAVGVVAALAAAAGRVWHRARRP